MLNWLNAVLRPWPLAGFAYLPRYVKDWIVYRSRSSDAVPAADSHPCLMDRLTYTPFDPHYFYQGAWLARRLKIAAPERHVDVGSSIMTIGVLSAIVDTLFVDYRPARGVLPGFAQLAANLTRLPFSDGSIASLSSLHVIEHVGLGRYGDPLDPEGTVKAASELQRILKPGGRLYIAVPIGRERVCFNAHRVFHPETIRKYFPVLSLLEFSFVDDEGVFREHEELTAATSCEYGCGMFMFERDGR